MPNTIKIISFTINGVEQRKLDISLDYSAVATAFVLVIFLSFGLAVDVSYFTLKLIKKTRGTRPPRSQAGNIEAAGERTVQNR